MTDFIAEIPEKKRRLLVIATMGVVSALLLIAVYNLAEGLKSSQVDYQLGDALTESVCPGEDLVYTASIKATGIGPVHFVLSWCRDEAIPRCRYADNLEFSQNITKTFPPTAFTIRIPIPKDLTPGSYTFSRSVQRAGALNYSDMLVVPFKIRDDCPAADD